MEWEDGFASHFETSAFASYRRCQLQEDNDELEDVDVDLANVKMLTSACRPHNIKPIFELVTESGTTDWAGVAETGKLRVAGDDMSDANRPRAVGIRYEGVELSDFELDWCIDLDFCFCFPDQRCNFSGDQGIQAMVEVFRELC